jgi:hypothetical protein
MMLITLISPGRVCYYDRANTNLNVLINSHDSSTIMHL